MSHSIRTARKGDARELARLFGELDHPVDPESISGRWDDWAASGNAALVAERADGPLLGVVTVHQMMVLHRSYPVGRITLLVVDPSARGRGIGRALVDAAQSSLHRDGCRLLEITSHVKRTDAHAFYDHLGFARTSLRFSKDLGERPFGSGADIVASGD